VRPTCLHTSAISRHHRNERAGGVQSTAGSGSSPGICGRRLVAAVRQLGFTIDDTIERDIIASKKASNRMQDRMDLHLLDLFSNRVRVAVTELATANALPFRSRAFEIFLGNAMRVHHGY